MMLDLEWFKQVCASIISPEQKIWIAYSGGRDSHVLLHLAAQALPTSNVVHINDHLSAHAELCVQHCQRVCAALNLPLTVLDVDVSKFMGAGLENAARDARRAAWSDLLQAGDILLLAHHAQDQAETVLYRLLRGAGPKGLHGMRSSTKLGLGTIYRPLLPVAADAIALYAQQQQLQYVQDELNQQTRFDRNYIRHAVLPLLTQRWPKVLQNINRAAQRCAEYTDMMNGVLEQYLAAVTVEHVLDLQQWQQIPELYSMAVLAAWLQRHQVRYNAASMQHLLAQVIYAKHDRQPVLVLDHVQLRRHAHKLYILKQKPTAMPKYAVNWQLDHTLHLPSGQQLTSADLPINHDLLQQLQTQTLIVRNHNYGRKAKKIFQRYAIPVWLRTQYPAVFLQSKLICLVGL